MGRLGLIVGRPFHALAAARGLLFPWVPVLIALGVGLWFALPSEPGPLFYTVVVVIFLTTFGFSHYGPDVLRPVMIAVICLLLGILAAGIRAHTLAAPVLSFRYYGPVEGRIVVIDRSQSDKVRLTLDQVVLSNTNPGRVPKRVRVSLHGDQQYLQPEPGQIILVTAHLAAPDGPVEPGGFDFRRMAFFDQLGAVGYARMPALLLLPPKPGEQVINRLRARIRHGVEAQIAGDPGAFAAALMTGDRAGIGQEVVEDLRRSNLSHLLAISGLHMGLLAGFVFSALRYGFALFPALALRVNSKKLAAIIAIGASWFYLLLSGGNVATERAFVMVAVMLVAVLFDRRALSLRSVAMAAMILLLAQPESLMEPGFQMSFAATVALVAGFAALRGRVQTHRMPWWASAIFTLVFSSFLAGLATAPVAAAHFNRVAGYGLLANLLAVPVMGFAVMPAAVLSGVLAPLGLEGPALWVMQQGTTWILYVANMVAGWEGSVRAVISPPAIVLPVMALGALWVILWRGPVRALGAFPVVAAFAIWATAERPQLLISADAGIIGLQTVEGRAISAEKGAGFAVRQWLENDGDMVLQEEAAAREGFLGVRTARSFDLAGWKIVQLKGKSAPAALLQACAQADLVIFAAKIENGPELGDCQMIDLDLLAKTGPVAISPKSDGLHLTPTRNAQRLWSGWQRAAAPIVLRKSTRTESIKAAVAPQKAP